MTTAFILTALAAAFTTGFLLGDSRAVRAFNAEVYRRNDKLEKMLPEREFPVPEPLPGDEQPAQPTRH